MTSIFVDADACPVREEIYRVAGRMGVPVLVVHNGSRPIRPPQLPGVQMVIVSDGADVADDWIAERIGPADICVTADIPLAKRCLEKGARALGHGGRAWTDDNIGSALAGREVSASPAGNGAWRRGACGNDQGRQIPLHRGAGCDDGPASPGTGARCCNTARATSGSSVMMPSTPQRASRAIAGGSFTVQGTTRNPAAWARASRACVSSLWCGAQVPPPSSTTVPGNRDWPPRQPLVVREVSQA